ncbi:MAG TPA: hypothetical protein VMK12_18450 [Anaeromyxobacteraceae bacterium]|nr:hypothetical protein [Anaeromyxobacteraceae bacterium]
MADHGEVPITIDKTHLKTPTPTTGAALYLLGKVAADYDLWLDVPGADDRLIPNDAAEEKVKAGSHYYTAKKKLNPGNG